MRTQQAQKLHRRGLHTCRIPTEFGWLFVSAATPLLSDFTGTLLLGIISKHLAQLQHTNTEYRQSVNLFDVQTAALYL